MNKIPLIILTGTTAVGKTALSIGLAKHYNCDIISCDSMQIYKYMDIGSAKIREDEKEGVKHYLIDEVFPDEDFSVSEFKTRAEKYIGEIVSEGKLPLITGGTGLYINSLIYKMDFAKSKKDDSIREKYEKYFDENGAEKLHDLLKERDPEGAERIHPNNVKRVVRALEILDNGGKLKDFSKHLEFDEKYLPIIVILEREKENLNNRIYYRVDLMFKDGLVDEVKGLLEKGYDKNLVSMQGIGYKEVVEYLEGDITYDECVEKIKIKTRQYAKRQRTWFRRYKDALRVNLDDIKSNDELMGNICEYIDERLTV